MLFLGFVVFVSDVSVIDVFSFWNVMFMVEDVFKMKIKSFWFVVSFGLKYSLNI